MALTNPCTGQELISEVNQKLSKSGDSLTGSLVFNNTDSYYALEKTRNISDVPYKLTLGVGSAGESVLEHYYNGNLDGRLEVTGAGLKWKSGTDTTADGYHEYNAMPFYKHLASISLNSDIAKKDGFHLLNNSPAADDYAPCSNWGAFLTVSDAGTPFQIYIPDHGGVVYKRILSSKTWDTIGALVVSGCYTGDDSESRVISLGFTPSWVWVFPKELSSSVDAYDYAAMGLATSVADNSFVSIADGGFTVYYEAGDNASHWKRTNRSGKIYNYVAGR